MKTKTLLLITFFGLLTSLELKAQQCGTPQTTNFPTSQRTIVNQNFLNNNEPICFNVFYHIVRQNNGSGGFNASLLDDVTEKLNLACNPHSLNVNNLGFDYIDNTTYYNIDDSGGNNSEFNALVQINNNPNAINIYIVNNAVSYAGRANGILSQALVIESSWANTQVMSHEVGHCLDLWHTFQGTAANTSGCAEAINGSNCTTCGDYVCDTPADANTGNSGGYTPNMDNIMSYYYPFDEFSNGQIDRVRNAFATSSILQQVVSNSCTIAELSTIDYLCYPTSKTLTISNLENSATTWQVSSNVTILSSNNSSVTIRAKYSNSSGNGWVKAALSNGVVLQEDFWVGKANVDYISFSNGIGEEGYFCSSHVDNEFTIYPWIQGNTYQYRILGFPSLNILYTSPVISGNSGTVYYTPTPGWYIFEARITNSCGTSDWFGAEVEYVDCSFGNSGGGEQYEFYTYPNPTSERLTIEKIEYTSNNSKAKNVEKIVSKESNYKFKLYNFQGELVRFGQIKKLINIDVSSLKKGTYFLQISNNGNIETHQIIFK